MNNFKPYLEEISILVIDDLQENLELMENILTRMFPNVKYHRALNGQKGLELASEVLPDVIILDILMPVLDGFETCLLLKKDPALAEIPVIFLTGIEETVANRAKALEVGAEGFLSKPIDIVTLTSQIRVMFKIRKASIEKSREKERLAEMVDIKTAELEASKKDLLVALNNLQEENHLHKVTSEKLHAELLQKKISIHRAMEIQNKLNQCNIPLDPRLSIAALFLPCEELGGDLIDIRKVNNHLMILSADCTGHGIEASLYSTILKVISDKHFHLLSSGDTDLFLNAVNKDAYFYFNDGNFPVLLALTIDLATMSGFYSSANYPLPVVVHGESRRRFIRPQGFHIGFAPEYVFQKMSFQLHEGEQLFIFSDALIEMKQGGHFIPENDALDTLSFRPPGRIGTTQIKTALEQFCSLPFQDDLSIISITYLEPYLAKWVFITLEEWEIFQQTLKEKLAYYDYSPSEITEINISLEEMVTNGIRHGNHNDPSKSVTLRAEINCQFANFNISDQGDGFDPNAIPDPTDLTRLIHLMNINDEESFTHGRGVWVTKRHMDEVKYNEIGNSVSLKKAKENPKVELSSPPENNTSPKVTISTTFKLYDKISWADFEKMESTTITLSCFPGKIANSVAIGQILRFAQLAKQFNKALIIYADDTFSSALSELGIDQLPGLKISII